MRVEQLADIELESAERVRDEIRGLGRRAIAVLVSNAGVTRRPYRASWDASVEDFAWIMSVNFWACFTGIGRSHRAWAGRARRRTL